MQNEELRQVTVYLDAWFVKAVQRMAVECERTFAEMIRTCCYLGLGRVSKNNVDRTASNGTKVN